MIMLLSLPLVIVLAGQVPTQRPETAPDTPAGRLELMKASVAGYEVRRPGEEGTAYRLQAEPVLRFTNSVGTVEDGAIFLWLDPEDRPAAAVQVFRHRVHGIWYQEFTSLSMAPLSAGSVWEVPGPGVGFRPVPGAPRPAGSAEARLRQMRSLAEGFKVEANFERKGWQDLRFLTRPLARYGKGGAGASDGALFACVMTTDPEAYLMLEARPGKDGPEWQFAFAPESIDPLRASREGAVVWELPYRPAWQDPHAPYYVHAYREIP